jgi:2'-5' RNA ligase
MADQDEITTNLELLYSKINAEGIAAISNGQERIDPILNHLELDKRLGLTLLISIRGKIAENFWTLEEELRKIEPEQYYYPEHDLHLTVIDLISANENFIRDDDIISQFEKLVENATDKLPPFDINFQGIIISNAAVLAKGYYRHGLTQLRERIRKNAIDQRIDLQERYQSISAHSTIVRFKSNLRHREELLTVAQKYHQIDLGSLQVNQLDLVIHDWYNRKKETIRSFILKD